MKNKIIFGLVFSLVAITQVSFAQTLAFAPKETTKYFNGPTVSNITNSGATLSLSPQVLADIAPEELSGIYFEYGETHQKTLVGSTTAILSGLKPGTTYTVTYKRDNSIRCITTPCPDNSFQSLSVEFTTDANSGTSPNHITKNLFLGMKDVQVSILQKILSEQGYLNNNVTGFFGNLTKQAVINYQKMHNIIATGFVGSLTRASFQPAVGEYFEGKISAYSTGCFVDGICSVTVDGKIIVTTRGWARDPVGTLQGVDSIGDIEKVIGHTAKVYAAKTADGYTLYGNTNFYIKVH